MSVSESDSELGLMACLARWPLPASQGCAMTVHFGWKGRGSVLVPPKGNIRITTFGAVTSEELLEASLPTL